MQSIDVIGEKMILLGEDIREVFKAREEKTAEEVFKSSFANS